MQPKITVDIFTPTTFGGIGFAIYKDASDGIWMAQPMQICWKKVDEYSWIGDPSLSLNMRDGREFLQGMANAAAKMGIHAEGTEINKNELAVTREWLEDMRALVFHKEPK